MGTSSIEWSLEIEEEKEEEEEEEVVEIRRDPVPRPW